jgi:hypothetical protein
MRVKERGKILGLYGQPYSYFDKNSHNFLMELVWLLGWRGIR